MLSFNKRDIASYTYAYEDMFVCVHTIRLSSIDSMDLPLIIRNAPDSTSVVTDMSSIIIT